MKRMVFVILATALFLLVPLTAWSGWVQSTSAPLIPTGQGLNGVNALYFINADTGLAVGFRGGVYKTTDGGPSWQKLSLPLGRPVDLWSVCFLNSQEGWAGADGIIHTIDGAMNWEIEDVPELEPYTLFAGVIMSDEIWFIGWYDERNYPNTHGILIRRSIHGGPWSVRKFPQFGGFFGIKVIAPNNVWLTGTNTVVQTIDYGQTFLDRSEGVRDDWANLSHIAFVNSNLGYVVGNNAGEWGGKFYITIDGGQSWSLRKVWGKEMQAKGLGVSGQTIYVAGGERTVNDDKALILASTDNGKIWTEVARSSGENTTLHAGIFQLDDTHMWAAWREFWYYVPNQQPLFAVNLGTTALSIAEQWQYTPQATDADGDSLVFTFLEAPAFLHIDSVTGRIWGTPAASDQGEYRVVVQVSDLNGGTDTMTFVLQVVQPTAVADEGIMGVPAKFSLAQNYPNPFNPATTIEYSLPTSADVRLSIYDLAGQELIILVSERQPTGLYSVKFTAANLPSGPYIVRLTAGGAAQTRKMLLLK